MATLNSFRPRPRWVTARIISASLESTRLLSASFNREVGSDRSGRGIFSRPFLFRRLDNPIQRCQFQKMTWDRLRELVQDHPKHFTVLIRKDSKLLHEIETATSSYDVSLAERISILLTEQQPMCRNGNRRRFVGVQKGFGYCGRGASCRCYSEEVSDKTRQGIAKRSTEDVERA